MISRGESCPIVTASASMTADDAPWPALLPVLDVLDRLSVAHHVGGSVASGLLAISRATQDVDLVADLQERDVPALVAALTSDYYIDAESVMAAVKQRGSFNIVHLPSMFKVDVFVAKRDAFSRGNLARSKAIEVPELGRSIPVCSPEDIVLHKLDWFRAGDEVSERQWKDVLGVLRLLGRELDHAYLHEWAATMGLSPLLDRALREAGLVN